MIVVGVTGKYCAGKSTASAILVDHGYAEIDVDALGHEALEAERERVIESFGERVRADDGGVDRKALGEIVFSDEAKLRELESILHPRMVRMTAERIAELRGGERPPVGVVVNAAILFRMRLHPLCDLVVYVTAPLFAIIRRARARDGATLRRILQRLRAQADVDPQYSRPDADIYTVQNAGDRERLRVQLARRLPLP